MNVDYVGVWKRRLELHRSFINVTIRWVGDISLISAQSMWRIIKTFRLNCLKLSELVCFFRIPLKYLFQNLRIFSHHPNVTLMEPR